MCWYGLRVPTCRKTYKVQSTSGTRERPVNPAASYLQCVTLHVLDHIKFGNAWDIYICKFQQEIQILKCIKGVKHKVSPLKLD